MKKLFLDANIILDFLDSSRINHEYSKKVFEKIIDDDWQVVISEDLLTTIYYIIKNKQLVLDFYNAILLQWEIVSFGIDVISEAINLCRENPSLDFEDVNQSLCARGNNCLLVITNDSGFYQCGIPAISSKEF